VTDRAWPDAATQRALCRLLCRPAPPAVDAERLEAAARLADLQPAPGGPPDRALEARLLDAFDGFRRAGGSLVTYWDPAYPQLLRHIARPPVALFVRGDLRLLGRPQVALVGARAASRAAREWTRDAAADLVRCGIVVASGLARGIDAAAHAGALDAGGATVAVLGCGPDVCYPPEHASLAGRIAAGGCLVTEFPPGTPPRPWHFPMRNRILAGITNGVVVVQAEPKSGALVTARHAIDENRTVMAVPGDVGDPRSRGPHALLRDGAALVEDAGDILRGLGMAILPPARVPAEERSGATAGTGGDGAAAPGSDPGALLAALGTACEIEPLRARLGWSAERLLRAVLALELAGMVRRAPGGIVCLEQPRC
jgi:DNA processing protein